MDGTLTPIVATPDQASVPVPTRELLAELGRRYVLVACLSGRRAADARRVVGLDALTYVGNHGLERLAPGAEAPELAGEASPKLLPCARSPPPPIPPSCGKRAFGSRTRSRSGPSTGEGRLTRPRRASGWSRSRRLAAEQGLAPHWGRKVLEIRPSVRIDKGTALQAVLRPTEAAAALYAGDDTTDLDAFRGLRALQSSGALEHSVCVGVGSEEGPAEIVEEADLVADGPDGVRELLALL